MLFDRNSVGLAYETIESGMCSKTGSEKPSRKVMYAMKYQEDGETFDCSQLRDFGHVG